MMLVKKVHSFMLGKQKNNKKKKRKRIRSVIYEFNFLFHLNTHTHTHIFTHTHILHRVYCCMNEQKKSSLLYIVNYFRIKFHMPWCLHGIKILVFKLNLYIVVVFVVIVVAFVMSTRSTGRMNNVY